MEDKKDIKKLFDKILGDKIILKDNFKVDDEAIFCLLVNKLDESNKNDEALFELSGIDLTKTNKELWFVIESLLKVVYGEEAFDMIMWYILDRFNPDGKVVPFEDDKGKTFSIITSKDLYHFIKHRFPK